MRSIVDGTMIVVEDDAINRIDFSLEFLCNVNGFVPLNHA